MKRITIAAVLLMIAAGCSWPRAGETSLADALNPWAIDRIEIYKMHPRTEVPTLVSASMLEQGYVCRLEVKDVRYGHSLPTSVLYNSFYSASTTEPDIRVGAVLFNNRNERIAGMFFDKSGRNATFNGKSVRIRGPIFSWINGLLSCP